MRKLISYLNPLAYLGKKDYTVWFAIIILVLTAITSEIFANLIVHDPQIVGRYIIFVHIGLIAYFAFRNGVKAGLLATSMAIIYYLYILYTRVYSPQELKSGIETTFVLGFVFAVIAVIIGYLKQTIDTLIEKEADERRRLQAIVDQLPVGVVIANKEGIVTNGNKWMKKILGREVRKGVKVTEEWPIAQTIKSGKPIPEKEFVLTREDGKEVKVLIGASVIRNRKGKVIAAASIINDITQQKELEQRKDDFVNMASHELRTPLTSMKLYLSYLQKHLANSSDLQVKKTLKSLIYQTDKFQELIYELLDVTRIQTGKLILHKEKMDLTELIRESIDNLKGISKLHKIEFEQIDPVIVKADKFRIYQVLTNLITNAIRYSPGGGKVKIGIGTEGRKTVVSIQDNGIGIARDQQSKIFERLYQVTEQRDKVFPGLGMGLYISREIMKRHKGRMWVMSERGKGSTFYFSL